MTDTGKKVDAVKHGPETEAYTIYFTEQKAKGLLDVKFAVTRGLASTEDTFEALNFCRNDAPRQKAKVVFAPKPTK